MSADLIRLWRERDKAKQDWRDFLAEADGHTAEDDPVVIALNTPIDIRTPEQEVLVDVYDGRHRALLDAVYAAERAVRVATGHEKP